MGCKRTAVCLALCLCLVPFGFSYAGPAPGAGADELKQSSWWSEVQKRIEAQEYEVSFREGSEGGWQAPNRAQDLRTRFKPEGIAIVPRTEKGPSWSFGLSFSGMERGGVKAPLSEPKLSAEGPRMTYDRGALKEWYVNTPEGVEQAFTIDERPAGEGDLVISLSVTSGCKAKKAGDLVEIKDPSGALRLAYGKLSVVDAKGEAVRATLDAGGEAVKIVLNDAGAVYPVTVDPLISKPPWIVDGDQEEAGFGWSVAAAGDVNGDGFADVIVGAPWYDGAEEAEGRVFVYYGSASGPSSTPDWTASIGLKEAEFGYVVSGAGDVNADGFSDVIVSASTPNSGGYGGQICVYHGSSSGLSAVADWAVKDSLLNTYFGISISTAGDVNGDGYDDVVVGACEHTDTYSQGGRAYVYHGSASGLNSSPNWTGYGGQDHDNFGRSVSTAGDVNNDGYADVIIGTGVCRGMIGRAYVYHGSASGLSATPDWTAYGDGVYDYFGYSVSGAGDVNGDGYSDVIVGAFGDTLVDEAGRAYAYYGSASGLSATPDWVVEGDPGMVFGHEVSTAGDVNGDGFADVMVADYNWVSGRSVFLYLGSSIGLIPTASWTFKEEGQALQGGFLAIASAGDVNKDGFSDVIVGSCYYDGDLTDAGRVWVWYGSPNGLRQISRWHRDSNQEEAQFGFSVAGAGDVNRDGFADIIVGAPWFDSIYTNEGKVFVFHGTAQGPSAKVGWSARGGQAGALYGYSVAGAGDVNKDGYADIVVGAPLYDNNRADAGRAFVYHGSATGLGLVPYWTGEAYQAGAMFGWSVACAGDVDNDGYSDVIVGAPSFSYTHTAEGKAYVFRGSASGVLSKAVWRRTGNREGAQFGFSVASAGDVNGDGFSDVLVGAPYFSNGEENEGKAFLFHGSSSGPVSPAAWRVDGKERGLTLGYSVSSAGDVNGDGYSDVLIGGPGFDDLRPDENISRVLVFHGSATGLNPYVSRKLESHQRAAQFGRSVSFAGDINKDGYSDILIGAPKYNADQPYAGRVFARYGSPEGILPEPIWRIDGKQKSGRFGSSVAGVGDVNGDGYDDFLIGAPLFDGGKTDEGKVFLYY